MKKGNLMLMVGISGSGKSTRAKEIQNSSQDCFIVSRDKLREMLFGYTEADVHKYYQLDDLFFKEQQVTKYQDKLIKSLLSHSKTVILDNTHVKLKYINEVKKKYNSYDISFEVIDTPLEECFKRNSQRIRRVDESVIKEQYNNLNILKKNFDFQPHFGNNNCEIIQNDSLPSVYIFDIDGTLAKNSSRSPYDYSRVLEDSINYPVYNCYSRIKITSRVIICTGRDGSCADDTKEWLKRYGIRYEEFHIRKAGDSRPDYVVKEEMWRDICQRYYVVAMFDDRNQVVDHARKLGFTVFQVAEGDF